MIGLTPRARELLVYLSERDQCPTFREMAAAIGSKGTGSIGHLVAQLEQRGYIRIRSHRGNLRRCRAITVLKPAYPPIVINGERYRFIPVSRGAPGTACEPRPAPLSASVVEPAVVPDLPVGAAAVLGEGR